MTPPEPTTGVRAPAATTADGVGAGSAEGSKPAPAWAKKVQRVQRESHHHDDGWLGAVELLTATFTWGGIGYLVDRFWLDTDPVFMSIGFIVGFFAGMYLLWLKSSKPADEPTTGGGGDADT